MPRATTQSPLARVLGNPLVLALGAVGGATYGLSGIWWLLPATLLAIVKEFRERYVVSYTPTGVAAGGWHAIDVRVKGRNLTVRARRGYGAN